MESFLIKGGRIIDPANDRDEIADLQIEQGRIVEIKPSISERVNGNRIDARGKIVCPGLIDMHVHARVPGQTHKEDSASLARAALAGGFTTLVCMANTSPVIDNPETLKFAFFMLERGAGIVDLFQVSAVTKNLEGEELVDLQAMKEAGVIAASDDGKAIQKPEILVKAMKLCKRLGLPLLIHCEDSRFSPCERRSEFLYVSLVLKSASQTGCQVHIQHVSCKESLELIKMARIKGVKVTAETCPHYFSLTMKDFERIGANAKMNPPLRKERSRRAVIESLKRDLIDVIATDHAPHSIEEKAMSVDKAPFGIIGLETAVAVTFSTLRNHLSISQIIAKMTINPARILGLKGKGTLSIGSIADITVIDPQKRKVVEPENFHSKARNCPWAGKCLQGWPFMTIKNGRILMKKEKVFDYNRVL